jgi:DNA-binding transcriptional ArsR family regulator
MARQSAEGREHPALVRLAARLGRDLIPVRPSRMKWDNGVLRAAGLVSSRRDGKMAMYSLTGPGRSLLRAVLDAAAVSA